MARTNFSYEKRQKELARQKKAEEKRLRRLEKRNEASQEPVSAESEVADMDLPVSQEERANETDPSKW